jgi:hypothetical protein
MERNVTSVPWSVPGLEHRCLIQPDEGILANGMSIGVKDNQPFRAQYQILVMPDGRFGE